MRLYGLFWFLSCAVFAQSTDGLSVSVNRTVTLAADEAVFTVVTASPLDVGADQVVQILQAAGLQNLSITGTGLGQVYSYPETSGAQAYYQVGFTVPAAGLKDAAKKLESLRTAPPEAIKALQYSAVVNAGAASVETGRQTILPQLLAEAQKKAQFLAASANVKLGAVKGVTESSYGAYALVGSWISTSPSVLGGTSVTNNNGMQYTYYASVTFSVTP